MNIFLPRGIRNNNLGNIRLSKTPWKGQRDTQTDRDFVEFADALHGLRALILIFLNGCATASHGDFCAVYQPVYTSVLDTEDTRRQVDGNNAVWLSLCPDVTRQNGRDVP